MSTAAVVDSEAPSAAQSPYKGLNPYTEDDAEFFFGRESERDIIVANLTAAPLTLLYGESGVGKSSVLRAGVVRHVRRMGERELRLGMPVEFVVAYASTWRDDPMRCVHDALLEAVDGIPGAAVPPLDGLGLEQLLDATAESFGGRVLLILDQFEEHFLYQRDDGGALDTGLVRVLNDPCSRASLLVSIREDGLAKLDRFKGQIPFLFDNYLRLQHLDQAAARAAIEKPVAQYNRHRPDRGDHVALEEDLVAAVLDEVQTGRVLVGQKGRGRVGQNGAMGDRRIETPYLQLVMTRLWRQEAGEGSQVLRAATLHDLGGADRIVRRHLDETMQGLTAEERDVSARIFHQLVTPSGSKIAHTADDLEAYADVDEVRLLDLLEKLSSSRVRILRPVAPPPDQTATRYEIFHDVLAASVLDWRARHLEKHAREEADASRRHAEERREEAEREARAERMRARRFRGLAVVALLLAGLSVFFMLDARSKKDAALSGRLAASAVTQLPIDPELSLLLAARAMEEHGSPEAEEALRRGLLQVVPSRQLIGHRRQVADGAFSPDGDLVATASRDGQVRIWDAESGHLLDESEPLGTPLQELEFAARGGRLVATGENGSSTVLDARTLRAIAPLPRHEGEVLDAAFSPDGLRVATAGEDGIAILADARTGRLLRTLRPEADALTTVDFSADGRLLLTAGWKAAVLWDADTGRVVNRFRPRAVLITSAALSPDGRLVALGGDDGDVSIVDAETRKQVDESVSPIYRDVTTVSFTPDSKAIVAAGEKTAWTDELDGDPYNHIAFTGHSDWVTSASVSSNGRFVLTASSDGTARLWSSQGSTTAVLRGHRGGVLGAALDDRSGHVLTFGDDRTARIWSPGRQTGEEYRGDDWQLDAQVTPDGKQIVAVGSSSFGFGPRIRVWRRGSTEPRALGGHTYTVNSVDLAEDGKYMVTAADDGTVRVWRTRDWRSLWSADIGLTGLSAHFSPDGRSFAVTAIDQDVRIFDVRRKQEVARLHSPDDVSSAVYTPDGEHVVTGGLDGFVRIFDVRTRRALATFRGHRGAITAVAASPDGHLLASTSADGTARVWDAATGGLVAIMRGHAGRVTDVEFSPDSTRIVTGDVDGSARVWNARSGDILGLVNLGSEVVNSAGFSPDGKRIVTTSDDKSVRVSKCETCVLDGGLLELAEQRVHRELTPEERKTYVEDGS